MNTCRHPGQMSVGANPSGEAPSMRRRLDSGPTACSTDPRSLIVRQKGDLLRSRFRFEMQHQYQHLVPARNQEFPMCLLREAISMRSQWHLSYPSSNKGRHQRCWWTRGPSKMVPIDEPPHHIRSKHSWGAPPRKYLKDREHLSKPSPPDGALYTSRSNLAGIGFRRTKGLMAHSSG